jgi:hypothetical protein
MPLPRIPEDFNLKYSDLSSLKRQRFGAVLEINLEFLPCPCSLIGHG